MMQKDKLTIRQGDVEDAKSIAEIESQCFTHPWTEEDIIGGFGNFTHYLVAEQGGEILGYCGIQCISGEGYITNVAVLPHHRGRGIASLILEELLRFSKNQKLEFVTLEVRESNTPAMGLYEKMGFETVGKRPNFYRDPKEAALLMTKFLKD